MKEIKFALCLMDMDDNIISQKNISTNWTVDDEKYLDEKFNISVHNEIASVIADALKFVITEDLIKDLIKETIK